ncbi:MAG: hypothetical protein K9I94_15810 [Bacteroidales bacterium]|nr:hypothetical protein [Bacteroidales bacterium]
MRTQKSTLVIAVLSVVFFMAFMSSQTFGQREMMNWGDHPPTPGPKGMMNWTAHIPHLTDNQIEEIENLREDHFQTMDSLRVKFRAAINRDKKEQVSIQMDKERLEHRKNIKALLNKEQREYYDEYSDSWTRCHQKGWMGHNNSNRRSRGNCCNHW